MPWLVAGLPVLIFRLVRWLVVRLAYRGVLSVIDRSSWLFAQVSVVIMIVLGGALYFMEASEPALQPSIEQNLDDGEIVEPDDSALSDA